MTLDPPVICRQGLAVAAVSEVRVDGHQIAGALVAYGRKCPRAILVHDGHATRAFRPDGRAMRRAQVERLCPGAIAAFENAVAA